MEAVGIDIRVIMLLRLGVRRGAQGMHFAVLLLSLRHSNEYSCFHL